MEFPDDQKDACTQALHSRIKAKLGRQLRSAADPEGKWQVLVILKIIVKMKYAAGLLNHIAVVDIRGCAHIEGFITLQIASARKCTSTHRWYLLQLGNII